MDGWTTFFVIILSVAFIVTIAVILRQRNNGDDESPSSTGTVKLPTSYTNAPPQAPEESTPPADVTVIYEGIRSKSLKYCANCGCEFDSAESFCEICGSTL